MNANADIHSLGRQGVAYGLEGSMGFSRASAIAARMAASSSRWRVRDLRTGAGEGATRFSRGLEVSAEPGSAGVGATDDDSVAGGA